MRPNNAEARAVSPKRVLIADDVALNRLFIKSYLHIDRHVVFEVEDGEAAIEKVHDNFDVLFLDLDMPKISGWDVLAFYRDYAKKRTSIFVITSEINEGVRNKALSLGASGVFERPLGYQQLRQAMLSIGDKDEAAEKNFKRNQ
jgi:CheY-like chemotaxis protein